MCEFCLINCNDQKCLSLHQSKICKKIKICDVCHSTKHSKHQICLNEKYCKNCKKGVDYDHKCYILTEETKNIHYKKIKKLNGYIFFDYEAFQKDNVHVANLIVADRNFIMCLTEKNDECSFCG